MKPHLPSSPRIKKTAINNIYDNKARAARKCRPFCLKNFAVPLKFGELSQAFRHKKVPQKTKMTTPFSKAEFFLPCPAFLNIFLPLQAVFARGIFSPLPWVLLFFFSALQQRGVIIVYVKYAGAQNVKAALGFKFIKLGAQYFRALRVTR